MKTTTKSHELQRSERVLYEAPVGAIVPSPTQPRSRGRDGADLVESIREHGVLEPLWVRTGHVEGTLELIFGERRWRGAAAAGLGTVPVELHDELSNDQIVFLQNIENSARADVTPMDEARSYELLRTRFRLEPPQIAAKVHKSERTVLARLRLLTLPEAAQHALEEGKLDLRSALALSSIENAEDREKATDEILSDPEGRDGPIPARHVAQLLRARYHLRLEDAQWSRDDATLVPAAGSCTTCPKRTGAQIALWAEGDDADRCTDRVCFEAKKQAHWERCKAAAVLNGQQVLDGEAAKKLFPYGTYLSNPRHVDLEERCYLVRPAPPRDGEGQGDDDDLEPDMTWRDALGGAPLPTTVVRDPTGRVHHVVDREAAEKALARAGKIEPQEPKVAPNDGPATRDAKIQREAAQSAFALALKQIGEKAAESKGVGFWRFMLALVLHVVDAWELGPLLELRGLVAAETEGDPEALLRWAREAKEPEVRGLVVQVLAAGHGDTSLLSEGSPLALAARFCELDVHKLHEAELKRARAAAAKQSKKKSAAAETSAAPAKKKGRAAASSPKEEPAEAVSGDSAAAHALSVPCKDCGAAAGASCTTPGGVERGPHKDRRDQVCEICEAAAPELLNGACRECGDFEETIAGCLDDEPWRSLDLVRHLRSTGEKAEALPERVGRVLVRLHRAGRVVEKGGRWALKQPALQLEPKGKRGRRSLAVSPRAEGP